MSISLVVTSRGVNRAVTSQLIDLHKDSLLGNTIPAYDGRKNLYTAGPFIYPLSLSSLLSKWLTEISIPNLWGLFLSFFIVICSFFNFFFLTYLVFSFCFIAVYILYLSLYHATGKSGNLRLRLSLLHEPICTNYFGQTKGDTARNFASAQCSFERISNKELCPSWKVVFLTYLGLDG